MLRISFTGLKELAFHDQVCVVLSFLLFLLAEWFLFYGLFDSLK